MRQKTAPENAYPSVYVVVLTYQMREVAQRCLASLRELSYPNQKIVVVDNHSTDGTEEAIRKLFPQVTVLQSGNNLGYTGGNNLGIHYAIQQGADYVLVLNPDTILVNRGFIEEMVAYSQKHPEVGIMGPRVFLREPGQVQNTVLFPPGLWRSLFNWIAYRISPKSFELSGSQVTEAKVLNGVCLLLRTDCLNRIGGFDENIFMYIEDAEMDYRARRLGWKVQYLPIDSVIHEQKREGYQMTGMVSFLLRRNSVYYLCKIGKRTEAWGYAIFSLLLLLARGAVTLNRSRLAEYRRFCKKLAAAYAQILLGRPFGSSFGPPFGPWQ